jgi:phosphotransferase system, enzyme I, PtsP
MLELLRSIVLEVSEAPALEVALPILVRRLQQSLGAEVASVYLMDEPSAQLVLMATEGLNHDAVGQVRLTLEEGLVGLVAARAEYINLDNAPDHPRYRYFPETGEERYHAFLGVPIIHQRQLLGVLVLQAHRQSRFSEDVVSLLLTVAAQLAGAIAHASASGGIDGLRRGARRESRPLSGQPGGPGVAIGTAVVCHPYADIDAVPDRQCDDREQEVGRFLQAVVAVREELSRLVESMRGTIPAADLALFEAYRLMLDSGSLIEDVVRGIRDGNWAPGALRATIMGHVRVFMEMEDPYLRERAHDVRDLGQRLLQRLESNDERPVELPRRAILVGEEIAAWMVAEIPLSHLAAVVSRRGSRTSHTAILARALGVPAVLGVTELPVGRIDGREMIVDGYSGRIYIQPSAAVRQEYRRLQRDDKALSRQLQGLRDLPAESRDGVRIGLFANTGLLADVTPSLTSGAEGVGLYRTEFPFMVRDRFPGEQEQYELYRQVLTAFHPRPVTMRTLDVGGDKALPYFPIEEDNPFLGWRGIRITLDHPEIFLTQIRAMLRASHELDNLRMLLPMVTTLAEVDEAVRLIKRAHQELGEELYNLALPAIGVMVEVPSLIWQIEALATRIDFVSIGSNDLTQYLLAVDRNNPRVAPLYDALHPAVLNALQAVSSGCQRQKIPLNVCGEMAGDPQAVVLLLGLGVSALSLSAAGLPRVKWVIRSFSRRAARTLLRRALTMTSAEEVRALVSAAMVRRGLGSLLPPPVVAIAGARSPARMAG